MLGASYGAHTSGPEETAAGLLNLVDPTCWDVDYVEELAVNESTVRLRRRRGRGKELTRKARSEPVCVNEATCMSYGLQQRALCSAIDQVCGWKFVGMVSSSSMGRGGRSSRKTTSSAAA